jgi:signal peptide peptidase SppA
MEPNALNKLQAQYLLEMKNNFSNIRAENFTPEDFDEDLTNGFISGEVGVLNVHGTISQFHDIFMQFFGGIGLDKLTEDFISLEKNPTISTIVLDIQSGGGSIFGVQKFTELVRDSKKATITITSNVMASAAFYIGTAADKIFVTDDMTHVGSVGVLIEHFDTTGLEDLTGVKKIPITAGSLKAADASAHDLDATEKAYLQQRANDLHDIFINDVAINLDRSPDDIRETFGSAKIFLGKEGIEEGFIDGKSSLETIIDEVNGSIVGMKEDILNIDFSEFDGDESNMKLADVTLEVLKRDNEALYNEIFNAGSASVVVEEKKEPAKTEEKGTYVGITKEDVDSVVNTAVSAALSAHATRIDAIDALGIVGFDKEVAEAKKNPNMTAGELAVEILKKQGSVQAKAKTDMLDDLEEPVNGEEIVDKAKAKSDGGIMTEDEFKVSAEAKKFSSYATYSAFVKNTDNVRYLNKNVS